MDIQRIKPEYADGFNVGDYIVIQEKIDGANAAIRYDTETDTIVAQSRKNILGIGNNLRGFYEWSQTLDKEIVKSVLGDNLILFMEWLVPHTLPYPEERYNHAYCYDVYNTNTEKYLPQSTVQAIVSKLNLTYVPTFYEGEFISWEHCMSFVGKTDLGRGTRLCPLLAFRTFQCTDGRIGSSGFLCFPFRRLLCDIGRGKRSFNNCL